MNELDLELLCTKCGARYPLHDFVYYCRKCGYPLEVSLDFDKTWLTKDMLVNRPQSMWRYRELLPVSQEKHVVTLSEGWTPLRRSWRLAEALGLKEIYIKDETRNPTWSFKDRGSSAGVSKALELGLKAVGCASSGNMASSLAAYAAAAGIRCLVLVPSQTPEEKVVQMEICGAQVVGVEKPYPEICSVGLETSGEWGIYWIHNDAPLRVEGQKTCSYEVAEQLGWNTPDWVVIPTSSGGNLSAHWKGWLELERIGWTRDFPSLVAVQAEGCSPIVKAFKEHRESVSYFEEVSTIASSISNPFPPSGERVLRILRDSRGIAESVSDAEMLRAQTLLASTEGLFAEPSSAASIAVLSKLLRSGSIDPAERIVCVITGSGLKDVKHAARREARPLVFKDWGEYRSHIAGLFGNEERTRRQV